MKLDVALAWYKHGVVAVPALGKVPCIDWLPWQSQFPAVELLQHWFRDDDVNIALICSKKLTVIDFDRLDGDDQFAKRARQVGGVWLDVLKHGVKVKTPHGYHVYVSTEQEDHNRSLREERIDIRGKGGIVITPPSISQHGNPYTIIPGTLITVDSTESIFPSPAKEIEIQTSKSTSINNMVKIIKESIDIVSFVSRYTKLRKTGQEWWMGRCIHPQHRDVNPSFSVNSHSQRAKCLSGRCILNEGSQDVIGLFSILNNVSNHDAIEMMFESIALT